MWKDTTSCDPVPPAQTSYSDGKRLEDRINPKCSSLGALDSVNVSPFA